LGRIDDGIDRGTPFHIRVDGEPVLAYPGETIGAALLAAGRLWLRTSARDGAPRGLFCVVGICHECRMVVDGQPDVRVCRTPARPGCEVRRQEGLGAADTGR
jgi:hypothetical protein